MGSRGSGFQRKTISPGGGGNGVGVMVGVLVGKGVAVAVGGTAVAVAVGGGVAVSVAGSAVAVTVGKTGVSVISTWAISVGVGIDVGCAVAHAASSRPARPMKHKRNRVMFSSVWHAGLLWEKAVYGQTGVVWNVMRNQPPQDRGLAGFCARSGVMKRPCNLSHVDPVLSMPLTRLLLLVGYAIMRRTKWKRPFPRNEVLCKQHRLFLSPHRGDVN